MRNEELTKLLDGGHKARNTVSVVVSDTLTPSALYNINTVLDEMMLKSFTNDVKLNTNVSTSDEPTESQLSPEYSVEMKLLTKTEFKKHQMEKKIKNKNAFDASLYFNVLEDLFLRRPGKLSYSETLLDRSAPDYSDFDSIIESGLLDQELKQCHTSGVSVSGFPHGHILFHTDNVPSTQTFMTTHFEQFPCHIVFIADQQSSARGRGSNGWVSPPGCLMHNHSIKINNPKNLPLAQYIFCWAVIRAVRLVEPDLDIRIKWPNDIYINGGKIGGILCQSGMDYENYSNTPSFIIHAGIGLNTTDGGMYGNINSAIHELRLKKGDSMNDLPPLVDIEEQENNPSDDSIPSYITREQLAANITYFISLATKIFNEYGFRPFKKEYEKFWLHSGTIVSVADHAGKYEIVGIAESGYLSAKSVSNPYDIIELHPDGNSFDMNQCFISPKKK